MRTLLRSACLLALGLLPVAAGVACKDKGDDGPAVTDDGAVPTDGGVEQPQGPEDVVLRVVAPPGQAPDQLVMTIGSDVFPPDLVGATALDGTDLRLDPAVDGQLRITGRNELAFTPTTAFRPGTKYTATLATVATFDSSLSPADGDSWSTSFTTPDLGLVRISPQQRDRLARVAELDLVFSGAVDPLQVASRLDVEADGKSVKPTRVSAGDSADTVRLRLEGAAVAAEEVQLHVSVAAGLPWAYDAAVTAAAGSASVTLADGKPVEIKAVMVKEGVDGHYVEVVCNDPSVGGERWYWDRDTWDGWDVSSRCMLADDQLDRIQVSQGGPVSIAQGPAGFRIFGDFQRGDLELGIDAGARTVDGGMLPLAWSSTLVIPQRQPRLSFASKGRYLPRSAWRSLAVEHLNTPDATLVVRHIPPANLAFWLSGEESASSRTSTIVLKQDLALGGDADAVETSWIDVGSLLPGAGRGVYELSLQGKDDASRARDASRLLLTDMQLVAKRAAPPPGSSVPSEVRVWALGSHDNKPISGVEVQLLRPSGAALATCRTMADGGCLLAVPDPGVDPTPPMAVVARKGEDLTYLRFEDVEIRPEADTSGDPYRSDAAYRAAIWSDRGVYRPGDTAHVAALVRDRAFGAPDAGLPVIARVFDPQRREVRKLSLSTNAAGMLSFDLPFADFATTGGWQVELQLAERQVGRLNLAVEEFVPERMAVDASAGGGDGGAGWLVTDAVPVDVEARWLFGGSAAGSRAEVACELVASPFQPSAGGSGQARWSYGLAFVEQQPPPPIDLGTQELRLDDEGQGRVSCDQAGRGAALLGSAQLVARVAVFEGDSGRATRAVARTPVHPARHYLGLTTKVDKVGAGDPLAVEGKVVDLAGGVLPGAVSQVELRLYRMEEEYGWIWDDEMGDTTYRRMLRRVEEDRRTVQVKDGRFTADLRAPGSATGWLIDVRGGGARTERYIQGDDQRWYWDPWESTVDATPRPQRPTFLEVEAPQVAEVGQKVDVRTKAPYAGRMLLTVETDRVQYHQWKDVQAGDLTWSVPLDVDDGDGGTFEPNVYITALLLKDPHLESADAFLPDRAYGAQSVRIRPRQHSLDLSVEAPEEARPWEPLKVSLALGQHKGPTWATVAVVDEGILQLTDFQTPDPRDQVFARRALGVDSFETVGWTLLDQPSGASSRTGGDAPGGGIGRVQMVKPVALWSGLVEVPASGKLDLSFDLPGYRGKLRVMAVAGDADRMGSAEASVLVRDPIVLQTTLPRFLVAGDIARIPVHLTNTTTKDRTVTLDVALEEIDLGLPVPATGRPPAVELVEAPGKTPTLGPDQSDTVVFAVAARRAPAAVRLVVTATAGDLRSREELDLPISNPEPEVWEHQQLPLSAGTVDLTAALSGWKEGTDRSRVWVTGSPHARALTHLGYLVRYPYGCVEQTTSGTRPLLYVRDLVEQIDPTLVASSSVDEMVTAGIERVLSMQTPGGGFAYWPGGGYASEWGTAYATHMLLDAKKAGFQVPDAALKSALDWLDSRIGGRVEADSTLSYGHYVLAAGKRARPAQAQRVLEAWQAQDASSGSRWARLRRSEAEYLLQAALYLGGDRRHEAALKRIDLGDAEDQRANDWSFWSALRGAGLRLAIHQDLFGADPSGDAAAERLASWVSRQSSSRYTTQELSWAITALGKRVQADSKRLGSVALRMDGKTVDPAATAAWSVDMASSARELTVSAPSLDGRAWVLLSTRGVKKDAPVPTGGQGLRLTRTWMDGAGKPLDPGKLPLGTPLYVRVDIQNTTNRSQDNIALVDRLPAGWEVENPRLSGADLPAWAQDMDLWNAEHMNIRDDRVEVFGELGSGRTRSVLFAVRAVTSGSFVMPPVQAEAMYDPDVWARQAGRTVEVVGPWDDGLL